ncbi:hypothetical protein C0J52_15017, partial [Blattella germanica]
NTVKIFSTDPDETSELLTPVVESSKVKCENEIELQEIKITPNTATEKSLRLAIPTRGCSKVQFENDTELKEIKSTQYSGLKKAGGTPQPATPVTAALHSSTQTMTRKIPIWCCTILFSISVTILFFFIYFQIRDIDE